MNQKALVLPGRIIPGFGTLNQVLPECFKFGTRGIIVHGRALYSRMSRWNELLLDSINPQTCLHIPYSGGEPTLSDVVHVLSCAKAHQAEFICGVGGGSVLDLAKAAAGLFHAVHDPAYYQAGGKLERPGIPFIAVPTLAGSGAEATPNAVITHPDGKTKLSIRDASFLARTVVLDGELLSGAASDALAFSGMDAFVQAYEAYVSKNSCWMTDAYAASAIQLIHSNLVNGVRTQEPRALFRLLMGSFLAGIALANARLGVIHGLAHPLGALYDLPHGLVCAACLIPSIHLNQKAMGDKYDKLGKLLGGDFLDTSRKLLAELGINSPFVGKPLKEKERIMEETLKSGSTAANPGAIGPRDVETLLEELFRF